MHALRLDGELTVHTAADRRAQVLSALDAGGAIGLDLSGVTEADTAGVQLLLVLRREADLQGRTLEVTGAATALRELLAVAGLDASLRPLTYRRAS